jgi:AcrR family transcriptional regulator
MLAKPALRPVGPSPRTRRAVLKAAADLLNWKGGHAAVTIEKIAARAKVAKTTVYRRWPSKIAIFMDVFEQLATKRLITEAQINPGSAALFRDEFVARGRVLARLAFERTRFRGELPADFDIELAIDILSGAIWYRLLLGHAPLDDADADGIVAIVIDGIRSRHEPVRLRPPDRARRGAR